MQKTPEELTIENENLKQGNIKVWEQLEKSTEILSHHEAYISLLEEENAQLKEYERIVTSYYMKPIDYETACETVNKLLDEKKGLRQENTKLKTENKWYSEQLNEAVKEVGQLKELLKECRENIAAIDYDSSVLDREQSILLNKIDQVLGEE